MRPLCLYRKPPVLFVEQSRRQSAYNTGMIRSLMDRNQLAKPLALVRGVYKKFNCNCGERSCENENAEKFLALVSIGQGISAAVLGR